ncbi:MAG: helix-turn-helix domain-containing protein [Geminicoccaceae bacterium]
MQGKTAPARSKRLTLSIKETCAITGLSRSHVYAAIARGALRSVKCGRRRIVHRADLDLWLDAKAVSGA